MLSLKVSKVTDLGNGRLENGCLENGRLRNGDPGNENQNRNKTINKTILYDKQIF